MSEEKIEKKNNNSEQIIEKTLIEERSIFIFGEITQELAEKVCKQLIALDAKNNNPIKIFINSPGGHVESGDTIHDMIKFIKSPVIAIGTGWVASAGITIYIAAEKHNRLSLPNTRYMIHQPAGQVRGRATDIGIEANEIVKMRERVNKLISKATGQPLERVTEDASRNYWLQAQEAIEYGIVGRCIESINQI